jgi:hypothetical protein
VSLYDAAEKKNIVVWDQIRELNGTATEVEQTSTHTRGDTPRDRRECGEERRGGERRGRRQNKKGNKWGMEKEEKKSVVCMNAEND